jgi:hypothetical protein
VQPQVLLQGLQLVQLVVEPQSLARWLLVPLLLLVLVLLLLLLQLQDSLQQVSVVRTPRAPHCRG